MKVNIVFGSRVAVFKENGAKLARKLLYAATLVQYQKTEDFFLKLEINDKRKEL